MATLQDKDGRTIDQCMVVVSRAPHSYTGEDTVEFHCHGSPAVLAAGLEHLYLAGAKPARRGEFIGLIGHTGSGKSTLARQLGEKYGLPVLHFDSIHFLPGWVETDRPYKREKVTEFLDANPEGWVMDGNYFKICAERPEAVRRSKHILGLRYVLNPAHAAREPCRNQ